MARVSQDEEAVGRRPASRICGGRLPRRRRDAQLPRVEPGNAPTGAGGCRARWRTRPRTGTAGPASAQHKRRPGSPAVAGPAGPTARRVGRAPPRVRSSGGCSTQAAARARTGARVSAASGSGSV